MPSPMSDQASFRMRRDLIPSMIDVPCQPLDARGRALQMPASDPAPMSDQTSLRMRRDLIPSMIDALCQPFDACGRAVQMLTSDLEAGLSGGAGAPHAVGEPGRGGQDARPELGPHRYRHLGGRRWSRSAEVGSEVGDRGVGFVADRRDHGNPGCRNGPRHDLFVEGHEVFDTAAAPAHDQDVRAGDRPARRESVEERDALRDLFGRALALHPSGPEDHLSRKPLAQAVQDIVNDRPPFGGHDADDRRQIGNRTLAVRIEQTLGRETLPAIVDHLQKGPFAGYLDRLDDQLVLGALPVRADAPGDDHLEPVFRADGEMLGSGAEARTLDAVVTILQRPVQMSGAGPEEAGDLAPHAGAAEGFLQRALDVLRKLTDRVLG